MADLDDELLERVARWCAEAGRTASAARVRRALAPLDWDELLAVRALLADPPPLRPLGPYALADLARGTPADVAADREREGRYPADEEEEVASPPVAPPPRAPPATKRTRRGRGPGVVIRRARDAAPAAPPAPPAEPLLDELLLPEGRGVLERLVRRHGARRHSIVAALAAWRASGGAVPGDADLSRLLDHHGLARTFARRERDELLHALRAAGGVRATAASRLGIEPPALVAALERLGATAAAERIRQERRAVLRARATLAERVRLVLSDAARLEDLGILSEVEEDLRRRLPELVRALRAADAPLHVALSKSLSVTPTEARALADRYGLPAGASRPPGPPRPPPPGGRPRPSASGRASPARRSPRPRTSRRSASSSSGRSGR
jgi:hypothetical protein